MTEIKQPSIILTAVRPFWIVIPNWKAKSLGHVFLGESFDYAGAFEVGAALSKELPQNTEIKVVKINDKQNKDNSGFGMIVDYVSEHSPHESSESILFSLQSPQEFSPELKGQIVSCLERENNRLIQNAKWQDISIRSAILYGSSSNLSGYPNNFMTRSLLGWQNKQSEFMGWSSIYVHNLAALLSRRDKKYGEYYVDDIRKAAVSEMVSYSGNSGYKPYERIAMYISKGVIKSILSKPALNL